MKKIIVLGSTGSIGQNTLKVAQHLGGEAVQVVGLAARSNIDLLEQQAQIVHPEVIAVYDEEKARELQRRLPHIPVLAGIEGICALATDTVADMAVSAMVGTLGLLPTISAIRSGKSIGLANKEALVSGGALIMSLVKEHNVRLLPIDSEHSAIFQCLAGEEHSAISRIILTSSGGPFRTFSDEQLATVSLENALQHPTWNMGPKITVDSSTLMNKGLEVIEAHWLFDLPLNKIDVVIHPQSILHSMVEFVDGSMKAQMSRPTMIVPIQYALTYPHRAPGLLEPFDFVKNGKLEFFAPNQEKFRCLALAYEAVAAGGSMSCYLNAANEVLVKRFLNKEISWSDISRKLDSLMQHHQKIEDLSLEAILNVDRIARQEAAIF